MEKPDNPWGNHGKLAVGLLIGLTALVALLIITGQM